MIKTYAVSLKKERQRRSYISNHLISIGLEFELIDGIEGSKLTELEKRNLVDSKYLDKTKWHFTNGQIGCILSHKNACKKIIEDNSNYGLIVEDDVVLPKNIKEYLISFEKLEFDVILLSYYSHKKEPLELSKNYMEADKLKLYKPYDLQKCASGMAYIISNNIAKKLVKYNMPISVLADEWGKFHHFCSFEDFYCLYPNITKVKDFNSTLEYQDTKSKFNKISTFVKKYNIPILKELLKLKSSIQYIKKHKIQFTDKLPLWERDR